jgi:osmotically-inducible protein OsmY
MNASENIKLISILIIFVLALSACEKPGPAEAAGKKIDQTIDDAGKKISDSADKVTEKVSEQSDKAGVAVDDVEITAKIKAAFFAESGLKTLQISVETIKGVVTLSGSVDSLSNSDIAQRMAGAVTGVSKVNNRLVLKSVK